MTELAIQTKNLTKIYGSGNTEVVAMQDASMDVAEGEVIALLGPSGSGKSTFLTAVGLINPPTSGQVSIGGQLVLDGLGKNQSANFSPQKYWVCLSKIEFDSFS